MAFLVWKQMDAELPTTRDANCSPNHLDRRRTLALSGAPHQLPDLSHTPTSPGG